MEYVSIEIPDLYRGGARGDSFAIEVPRAKVDARDGRPIVVYKSEDKHVNIWLWKMQAFVASDLALSPDDVVALANEADNTRRLRLAKAHALQAMSYQLDKKAKRTPIGRDVKISVWQRDGGRCVECGANEGLEFDHIIPLAMGGANTMRNLQLLCEMCNRRKGASLG